MAVKHQSIQQNDRFGKTADYFKPYQEKKDGFMIDNEDIGRDIDLLTDQVRPLHDRPLTPVAKIFLIESIDECKTRGPLHLLRSDS
jgi:hypothetical protein